jgi:hypothetical protein
MWQATRHQLTTAIAATAVTVGASINASAQQNQWEPLGAGTPSDTTLLIEYQGDLIAVTVGGTYRWDGISWTLMSPVFASALTVHNGELYRANNAVSRWDGASWVQVGAAFNGTIEALTTFNGELIAGGNFTAVGTQPAHNIARFDGVAWQRLGDGARHETNPADRVESLSVVGSDLIVGGFFSLAGGLPATNLAAWNGSSWSQFGGGRPNTVGTMLLWNDELWIRQGGTVQRWTGASWQSLPSLFGASTSDPLILHDDMLVASSNRNLGGGVFEGSVQRWTGSVWEQLGGIANGIVRDLTVLEGEIVAAGSFNMIGSTPLSRIAVWRECNVDTDLDGLLDIDEINIHGTDPNDPDSDDDGLLDGTEVNDTSTDPLDADSDDDGLTDGQEVNTSGTDPNNADTDGDGLNDFTDPTPLEPGATGEWLEDQLRLVADAVSAIGLSDFNGPNDNANKGRRNSLSNRIRSAANEVAEGDYESAIELLAAVLAKVDGDSAEPDWMDPSANQQALADELSLLIALLLLE